MCIRDRYEILRDGSSTAKETAAKTLEEVRHAMKIDYFQDPAFLEEQKRFQDSKEE